MNRDDFLRELEDIVQDPIFIGKNTQDLQNEISANMWSISLGTPLAEQLTAADLKDFFQRVIANRELQIIESKCEHGMLFYVWIDWQAAQLRLNLISQVHGQLPFREEIEIVNELEPLLRDFIHLSHRDGFLIEEEVPEEKSGRTQVFLIALPQKQRRQNL
ncbi:hypothetical protein [Brevibacillus agri]|uniref:hypothetical protein n=1 Tax=Brevibacillus agri TaxID=51101 RepID=UPI000685392D|nr:hypothetical protein [Brevibacillus agri]